MKNTDDYLSYFVNPVYAVYNCIYNVHVTVHWRDLKFHRMRKFVQDCMKAYKWGERLLVMVKFLYTYSLFIFMLMHLYLVFCSNFRAYFIFIYFTVYIVYSCISHVIFMTYHVFYYFTVKRWNKNSLLLWPSYCFDFNITHSSWFTRGPGATWLTWATVAITVIKSQLCGIIDIGSLMIWDGIWFLSKELCVFHPRALAKKSKSMPPSNQRFTVNFTVFNTICNLFITFYQVFC